MAKNLDPGPANPPRPDPALPLAWLQKFGVRFPEVDEADFDNWEPTRFVPPFPTFSRNNPCQHNWQTETQQHYDVAGWKFVIVFNMYCTLCGESHAATEDITRFDLVNLRPLAPAKNPSRRDGKPRYLPTPSPPADSRPRRRIIRPAKSKSGPK